VKIYRHLQVTMLEIRSHGYPKEIQEPGQTKVFNEYRYVCPECGSEWIHDTLFRRYEPVVEDAEFHFGKCPN